MGDERREDLEAPVTALLQREEDMNSIVVVGLAGLAGVSVRVASRIKDRRDAEAERQRFQLDEPTFITISGVTYFRRPWEYGLMELPGSCGQLKIATDKLVLSARNREKLGPDHLPGETDSQTANSANSESVAEQAQPYRIEIPKSSIRRIHRPWTSFRLLRPRASAPS